MKVLALVAVLGTLTLAASRSVSAESRASVFAVATFPSIGTVYGRYESCSTEHSRFALGIRLFADASSTSVRFRTGRLSRDRNLWTIPRDTSWFCFSSHRVQWLAAAAGGEGGVWVGVVRVVSARANSARGSARTTHHRG